MSALLALESALANVGFILSSTKLSSFELFPESSASSSDISASEDTLITPKMQRSEHEHSETVVSYNF